MAIEKIFKPMLKREPMPYASGQNIVSDVKKAKRYSEELERITITNFSATVVGDNKDHQVTYEEGTWGSDSAYFKSHGVCAYTMTMERLLKGMVKPIQLAREFEVD